MPTNENNILKCYHGQKSIKVPFVIYIGFETVLEKSCTYYVNLETLHTSEIQSNIVKMALKMKNIFIDKNIF